MPRSPSADLPELADRLIKVRQSFGLNQREFAERLGVSWRALQDYEQGKSVPGGGVLGRYAECGIDLNWLMVGNAISSQLEAQIVQSRHKELENFVSAHDLESRDQEGRPSIMFGLDVLNRFATITNSCFSNTIGSLAVCKIRDDSMEPTLSNGSLMVADRDDSELGNGLYLLSRGSGYVARRVQALKNGNILLRCDNPQWSTELVQSNRPPRFDVIGRILFELKAIE